MNVVENIKTALGLLEDNEKYCDELYNLQSSLDRKVDYWLHYIELNNVKVTDSYKIIREIKRLRTERRKCKNDLELMKVFHDNQQKLCNASNRKILLNQVCKTDNKQQNAKYGYDAYTDEEIKQVLGREEIAINTIESEEK